MMIDIDETTVEEVVQYEEMRRKERVIRDRCIEESIKRKIDRFFTKTRFYDTEYWVSLDGTRRHLSILEDDHLLNLSAMLDGITANSRLERILYEDVHHLLEEEEKEHFVVGWGTIKRVANTPINEAVKSEIGRRWTQKRIEGEI